MHIYYLTISATDDGTFYTPWTGAPDGTQNTYHFSVKRAFHHLKGFGVDIEEWSALMQAVNTAIEHAKKTIPGYDPENYKHDLERTPPNKQGSRSHKLSAAIRLAKLKQRVLHTPTQSPHQQWVKVVVDHLNATFGPVVQAVIERRGNLYWCERMSSPPQAFAQLSTDDCCTPFQHTEHSGWHPYDSIDIMVETVNNKDICWVLDTMGATPHPVAPPTVPKKRKNVCPKHQLW
eukprot:TRINITY_DN26617_c0_g1_i1.p1 TRINITY_DN26617_c0_g1~~TRINITY_DN26617_c0_g1_i1.p1  ORF type:complete len:233 (+),score=15.26 TRINITY_DN26617_c0_g1_i1:84-782(+)